MRQILVISMAVPLLVAPGVAESAGVDVPIPQVSEALSAVLGDDAPELDVVPTASVHLEAAVASPPLATARVDGGSEQSSPEHSRAAHAAADQNHDLVPHRQSGDEHGPSEAPGRDVAREVIDTLAPEVPANDRARGLVFDGLRPGRPYGSCPNALEVPLANGTVVCSHGPDVGPPGLDVRVERSSADLAEDAASNTGDGDSASNTGAGVPCLGDGVSDNRVQAVYAVASDRTDRFTEIAALIPDWAAAVEEVFSTSAAQVGGERHVRFVTDGNCDLDIAHVVLSPSGDDNFSNTINELTAAGFDRADRKYLVWMDASVYCGIAQIYPDDRPGHDNPSNVRTGFGRIDQGCWGRSESTEAHELVHALGGVQPSAPHGTAHYHCSDEYDRMCYRDSADVVLTFDCSADQARYLDCNHDDYYHPNPPAGSYLDTHWNVADSSFLHAGPVGDPPPDPQPPTNTAPVVSVVAPTTVMLADGAPLDGVVSDDGMPGPYTVDWSQESGPGTATFADGATEDTTVAFSTPGTYVLVLIADDGDLTGDGRITIDVEQDPPRVVTQTTATFDGSLSRKWPARTFEAEVAEGPSSATLSFGSRRGKKASTIELTLDVYGAGGNLVASSTGPSPVQITTTLSSGSHSWVVSGARTSFSLEVTHLTAS